MRRVATDLFGSMFEVIRSYRLATTDVAHPFIAYDGDDMIDARVHVEHTPTVITILSGGDVEERADEIREVYCGEWQ